jgi:hypothetical protein
MNLYSPKPGDLIKTWDNKPNKCIGIVIATCVTTDWLYHDLILWNDDGIQETQSYDTDSDGWINIS